MSNKVYVYEGNKYIMEFMLKDGEGVNEITEIIVSKHPDLAQQSLDRIARKFNDGTLNIKN